MKAARRITSKIAATTAAAVFCAAGLQASEMAPPHIYPQEVTGEQKQRYQGYFDTSINFWARRGVPAIQGVGLVILSGDDRFDCYGTWTIRSGDTAVYCPGGGGTVVITAADIYTSGSQLRDIQVVGHEVGHGVQDKTGKLDSFGSRMNELDATCKAAEMARSNYPLQVMSALAAGAMTQQDFFEIGDDKLHGSHQQQEAAFMQGFAHQDCTPYQQ